MLGLRQTLLNHIEFKIGNGDSLSLWYDPWHSLGPLISRFPWGLSILQLPKTSKLSSVIIEGEWHWPPITAMECNEIIQNLPHTCRGNDLITWRLTGGEFNIATAYDVFHPPGPKVGWSSLLLGRFKTPRYSFILWLAIHEKLSTMDKPWLARLGGECVLCHHEMETHDHLFFKCIYSRQCLYGLKRAVRFYWRNHSWVSDVIWAARKWRGKHYVNAAFRALLASILYHIWQERNRRVFQGIERPSSSVVHAAVDEIRQRIVTVDLPNSVSKRGLYRLWRIPWSDKGTV
ncbi:UNVERIFIED_CONTAM: hypothetical protein Sradi_3259500 [Sesamum radiatum]|uniref:Reverse transcriptase zinc-binding domain-containing protein n=1 Tax=Sesamum radiatum TaxID=300843 RepID=A0AAW2R012_SESRA